MAWNLFVHVFVHLRSALAQVICVPAEAVRYLRGSARLEHGWGYLFVDLFVGFFVDLFVHLRSALACQARHRTWLITCVFRV